MSHQPSTYCTGAFKSRRSAWHPGPQLFPGRAGTLATAALEGVARAVVQHDYAMWSPVHPSCAPCPTPLRVSVGYRSCVTVRHAVHGPAAVRSASGRLRSLRWSCAGLGGPIPARMRLRQGSTLAAQERGRACGGENWCTHADSELARFCLRLVPGRDISSALEEHGDPALATHI